MRLNTLRALVLVQGSAVFTTAAVNEQTTGCITTVVVHRTEEQSCIYMEISVRVGLLCDFRHPSCGCVSAWTSCELLTGTVYLLMNPPPALSSSWVVPAFSHTVVGRWTGGWSSSHCNRQRGRLRPFIKQISSTRRHLYVHHSYFLFPACLSQHLRIPKM